MPIPRYNPKKIEKKWQEEWEKKRVFEAETLSEKPKYYVLVEFPYPSGSGLHVGHCRSYVALDVISRKKRMEGFNVLFPMGWDAFGLPTENYAIKTGIHPVIATKKNTLIFKRQEKSLGLSFDWSREINTTDPSYYRWTQWIFLNLFKNGLAYKAKMPINWCPACKISLANEEVVDGKCERCGTGAERREKEQWLLRITKYAERLIKDLDIVDYPEKVKISQKEWIGRSEGVVIQFSIFNFQFSINVFTTRIDTIFGVTYLVLSPEHPFIEKIRHKVENWRQVKEYIEKAKSKLEKERVSGDKEKTGVELKGIKAVNPLNDRELPVFVSDYVLMNYGSGAVMAVPAHDQRDFLFAKKYNLPIVEVIKPKETRSPSLEEKAYEGEGVLVNSKRFDGMDSSRARQRISEWLSEKGLAKKTVNYKLRDWIFSRQRYWGEPIPMINCQKCARLPDGQGWVPVPEKDLPVLLPKVENYKPTEKGESPLAQAKDWINVKCPQCGEVAQRETDVMPNWAGSNWYYLRYCDPHNDKAIADQKLLEYWMPVDWYNGGMEHTTLHLLYSRFIYKFLWDISAVPKSIGPEPYKKRTSHGMILGEAGIKMSKSKGNVVNPDDVIKEYGADTMRIYEMFMGPFVQAIPWDAKGVIGAKRFLGKIWELGNTLAAGGGSGSDGLKKILHKTIKKVSQDIELLKFNTAVSSLMKFVNAWSRSAEAERGSTMPMKSASGQKEKLAQDDFKDFLKILSPFAPHLAEELWQKAGFGGFCCSQKWPEYSPELVQEKNITLIIQINGRTRDTIEVPADITQKEAEETALAQEKIRKWVEGKEVKNIIFVPGKLVNIVV